MEDKKQPTGPTIVPLDKAKSCCCLVVDKDGKIYYHGDSSHIARITMREMNQRGVSPIYSKTMESLFKHREKFDYRSPEFQTKFMSLPKLIRTIYVGVLKNQPVPTELIADAMLHHPEYF